MIPRASILVVAAACASCSLRTSERLYQQKDPLPFTFERAFPENGAKDIALGSEISIYFSDFPDPASVSNSTLSLRSNNVSFDYTATVDLVNKRIRMLPRTALTPNAGYTVAMPSDKLAGVTLTSIGRVRLTELVATDNHVVVTTFETGAMPGGGPAPPAAVSAAELQPLFIASCASEGCHDGAYQSARLDLSSADASYRTLLARSSQFPSMERVRPRAPADSYLIRKLLGTSDIQNEQMPLNDSPWTPPENIQLVSDWIAGGANP